MDSALSFLQRATALGLTGLQLGTSATVVLLATLAMEPAVATSAPEKLAQSTTDLENTDLENSVRYQQRLEQIRQQLNGNSDANEQINQEFNSLELRPPVRPGLGTFANPSFRPELPPLNPTLQPPFLDNKFGRYRLGPSDVIFINVQRFPNLNFQGPISPEGTIVLPLVGSVILDGLTVGEARERVRAAYDRYIVNPVVDISLLSQRPVRVTVVGRVASPGFYPLQTAEIAEALRTAGGTLASADLRRVQIRRTVRDRGVIEQQVDLYSPLVQGLSFPDLRLEDGDTITVPQLQAQDLGNYDRTLISNSTLASQRPVQVTVIGEVAKPGFYGLSTGRVGEALLVAGGSLNSADLRKVEVRRNFSDGSVASESVDLYSPLATGASLPNLRLEEGDVVSIPKLTEADKANYDSRLIAKSNVSKPNIQVRLLSYAAGGATTLNLPSGSTFRDALNGIPLDAANLSGIALVRYDPQSGKAIAQTINGKNALMGDPSADVPLQDNDVVVVGRGLVARISHALNIFTQPFRDILGFLLFFDSLSQSASNLFQPNGR